MLFVTVTTPYPSKEPLAVVTVFYPSSAVCFAVVLVRKKVCVRRGNDEISATLFRAGKLGLGFAAVTVFVQIPVWMEGGGASS